MSMPAALRPMLETGHWLLWRWVWKDGKWDKPPLFGATVNNPESWLTFDNALTYAMPREDVDGVGFGMLTSPFVAVDIDGCRDPATGQIAEFAQRVVDRLSSYTEITVSGTGLRIIGTNGGGSEPLHSNTALDVDPLGGKSGAGIELYRNCARYITVSGDRLPGTPDQLLPIGALVEKMLVDGDPLGIRLPPRRNRSKSAAEPRLSASIDMGAEQVYGQATVDDVTEALSIIPNPDLHWEDWVAIGLAAYASNPAAYEAWEIYSRKSSKYNAVATFNRWEHFRTSPPTRTNFGSLINQVRCVSPGWIPPSRRPTGGPGTTGTTGTTADGAYRYKLRTIAELRAEPPPEWLIKGLIPTIGLGQIYGESGAGKTFVAIDMFAALARGVGWAGKYTKRARVVYVVLEGNLRNRLEAYRVHHGLTDDDLADFRVVKGVALNLLAGDHAALVADIKAQLVGYTGPIVIAIDTMARTMAGGDENASKDVSTVIAAATAIQNTVPAMVFLVHHAGKDLSRGSRGWSGQKGALEVEIEVSRTETSRQVTFTKVKDGEDGITFDTALEIIELGPDEDSEPVTSCVAVIGSAPTAKKKPGGKGGRAPSGAAQEVAQAIRDAVRTGTDGINNDQVPGHAVRESRARDLFNAAHPIPKEDGRENARRARNKRWTDGIAALLDRGMVSQYSATGEDGWIWLMQK